MSIVQEESVISLQKKRDVSFAFCCSFVHFNYIRNGNWKWDRHQVQQQHLRHFFISIMSGNQQPSERERVAISLPYCVFWQIKPSQAVVFIIIIIISVCSKRIGPGINLFMEHGAMRRDHQQQKHNTSELNLICIGNGKVLWCRFSD